MARVIWWTPFCGNLSIYDAFWVDNLTLYTQNPDLTKCYQNTVLAWISCGFLWLVLPVYSIHLFRKKSLQGWRKKSLLYWIKMTFSLLIVLLQVMTFFKTVHENHTGHSPAPVYYVTPVLMFVTFIMVMVLQHVEFHRGVHSSGVLVSFWTLSLITGIITFRSNILQKQMKGYIENLFRFVTFIMYFVLILAEWTLSLCVEGKLQIRKYSFDEDEKSPLLAKDHKQSSKKTHIPKPSPEISANVLSAIFYTWVFNLMRKANRNYLKFDDIYSSKECDKCTTIVPAFLKEWQKEKTGHESGSNMIETQVKKKTNSYVMHTVDNAFSGTEQKRTSQYGQDEKEALHKVSDYGVIKALLRTFKWDLLKGFGFRLLSLPLSFSSPLLLRVLLNFLMSDDLYMWKGYTLAVLLGLSNLSFSVIHNRASYHDYSTGIRMRAVTQAAIYRKALRLSTAAKRQTTVGQIVSLISIDTPRLSDSAVYLGYSISVMILSILVMALMWQTVGVASLAGLAVMCIAIPLNGLFVAYKIRNLQKIQMILKDQRLRIIGEILSGIKILKFYAWEDYFRQKVLKIRNKELKAMKHTNYWQGLNAAFTSFNSSLMFFVTILAYMLASKDYALHADTAFVTLALVNVLSQPLTVFATGVTQLGQTVVSLVRINSFLTLEEVPDGNVTFKSSQVPAVQIKDGYFSWSKDETPTLKEISLSIPSGSLIAIVGHVGSGKSSLMFSMLGEMWKLSGSVTLKGTVSFVSQQAWILNDTLRGNIIFGKSYNKATCTKILDACAMTHDLKLLPGGDLTEIGEKGVNLSGGQRQRLSIARAVYQDHDIYLLDDPLSAVDAHVGRHIFERVIGPKGMLKNKTRVLATHNVTYLQQMDTIFVIRDGGISESGTYEELMSRHGDITGILRSTLNCNATDSKDESEKVKRYTLRKPLPSLCESASGSCSLVSATIKTNGNKPGVLQGPKSIRSLRSCLSSLESSTDKSIEDVYLGNSCGHCSKSEGDGKLIEEEESDIGGVKLHVIWSYIKAAGVMIFLLIVLLDCVGISIVVYANIWLSDWTSDPVINGTRTRQERDFRLAIYATLIFSQIFSVLSCFLGIGLGCVMASRTMHNKLVLRILHAPMSFFDTTPLGRIMNRMSKDMDGPDTWLPTRVMRWVQTLNLLTSALIIMTYNMLPLLLIVIPLILIYFVMARLYIKTANQLRRIESVTQSPLLSHFDESIVGASSIRAYREQDRFIETNDLLVENCSRTLYLIRMLHRLLFSVGGLISCILVTAVSCFAVAMRDSLTPGVAGMTITYTLQVGTMLSAYMWSSVELESWMVAIERLFEYSNVEQEAAWEIEETKPDKSWPSVGAVEYRNYQARYRPGLDLVLKDISFTIKRGEKIGVVGRTGAGKSSLTLSLFRIIEATGGAIYIDGIQIASLGLADLRSRLTVIPQDPVIFSGSIRFNLDPFLTQTDDGIWNTLAHVHLKSFVASLPGRLEYECGENGESLSIGQRQLVCLARALLRKSKVLVLDEATAAVDLETDNLIQQTIRTHFSDRTVISVAHRLRTVLDYDRVMVMDSGRIIEADRPQKLLDDNKSVFYGMAREAGII